MAAALSLPPATSAATRLAAGEKIGNAMQTREQAKMRTVDEILIGPREQIFRSPTQLPSLAHSNLMSELVKRTAAGLVTLGVKPKDVVYFLSPNSPEFPVVYLAIVYIGAVAALGNSLNTENDIALQLVQTKAVFVITVPEQFSKIQKCNLPTILIGDDVLASQLKTTTSVSLLSEVCEGDYIEMAPPECHPDDTCSLLFSSGTTGLTKAIQLTHRNLMSSVTAYNTLEPGDSTREDDVCVAIIPMFHVFGLGIIMLSTLQRGACVVTMTRYSFPSMLQYIEKYKITVAIVVPPILVYLVKNQEMLAKYDLSSLRILMTGAAPLREDTMKSIQAIFPKCVTRQGYGMTEYPLPVMTTGEVWVRGPQIMKGYLNNVEQTSATIDSDGWLHTGDLGYMDNNNYLFIIDRLKEMIKYRGHQVAPGDLEAVLLKNPRILDACVVPCPDDDNCELPMAFVVKRECTDLTELEVMNYVAQLVAPYKKVRKVEFIDAIPKSPTGKILRKQLTLKLRETGCGDRSGLC
nr:4-coumarate--CoA ligase-like 7 [Physcomitrium patens]|eukprot:XP_024370357.1 4-coumarate--CoA ligase-like 7 [Physcomitrella patens]